MNTYALTALCATLLAACGNGPDASVINDRTMTTTSFCGEPGDVHYTIPDMDPAAFSRLSVFIEGVCSNGQIDVEPAVDVMHNGTDVSVFCKPGDACGMGGGEASVLFVYVMGP